MLSPHSERIHMILPHTRRHRCHRSPQSRVPLGHRNWKYSKKYLWQDAQQHCTHVQPRGKCGEAWGGLWEMWGKYPPIYYNHLLYVYSICVYNEIHLQEVPCTTSCRWGETQYSKNVGNPLHCKSPFVSSKAVCIVKLAPSKEESQSKNVGNPLHCKSPFVSLKAVCIVKLAPSKEESQSTSCQWPNYILWEIPYAVCLQRLRV